MVPGQDERALELLEDIDARLAGLEVGYSAENATAARELVDRLGDLFDDEPAEYAQLRAAVDDIVESETADRVGDAKAHADELGRQVATRVDEEG
jgi:hypothetical protein